MGVPLDPEVRPAEIERIDVAASTEASERRAETFFSDLLGKLGGPNAPLALPALPLGLPPPAPLRQPLVAPLRQALVAPPREPLVAAPIPAPSRVEMPAQVAGFLASFRPTPRTPPAESPADPPSDPAIP